jgi:hypothetical protein
MACQILKSSTSKNMQWVGAALMGRELILICSAEIAGGQDFERLWRRNE